VLGDISSFLELAIGHFRHLGLRSFAMFLTEEGTILEERLVKPFRKMVKSGHSTSFVTPADRDTVWNPEAEVRPLGGKLASWLRSLPKPVGVVCPQLGGGGYLIRCCKALGLRVPEDVAVIGSDDTDLSLASNPTLTSVVLSMDLVGVDAVRILADMIAGKKPASSTIRLKSAQLTVRESTGRRRPEICDIAGALECIQNNATRGINVEQVMRQTQRVSRVTFHRRFREATGKSPAEAIRDRQLDEVRRLLISTELPVAMISDLAGFSSPKVLARTFRDVEKTTPRDFRRIRRS
jgi:LacI family transcriptional regulator